MKIIGNVVGTTLPKPNLAQTDPKKGDYVKGKSVIPTKVSQLENDKGYLTEHQDISGKLDANKLPEAIDTALAQAKASGEFDGKDGEDGYTPVKGKDYVDGAKGEQGYSFVTSVDRPSFTEAQWATYGEVGHTESWSNTESIRNGCRIGDIFTVVGTATDTKNAHVAYYRCTIASGNLRGTCIAHSIAERGATGADGSDATVTAESIANALGYTPADKSRLYPIPQDYGAKGDGSTDDTAAFQNALANNRIVFVPGGSYKISAELIIGNNCQLELAQDATLYFTQTTGNCISLLMCSWIKGNHATVSVPYGFTGNVINIDTGYTDDLYATPPFKHWDPVWKPSRYVTDLNIVKPNSYNLNYSDNGECSGTAIYIETDGNDLSTFLWGIDLSGLRIAGAFTYGVYGITNNVNGDSGWNHDMKLGGLISGCETGVKLTRVHKVYLSTLIQPQKSRTGVAYAKNGIVLNNCRYMNLINARTFDWNSNFTLWEEGNENQHIALYGDCSGLVLEDWNYYAFGADYDIRSLIYTDTPRNLERMVILQEPITRWFKPKDGTPYFYDGNAEKRLTLKEEFDECFTVDRIANFEDVLSTAFNKDGTIFNEIGYIPTGAKWVGSSGELVTGSDYSYYGATGFIKIKNGDIINADALNFGDGTDTIPCVVVYDANFNRVDHASAEHLAKGTKSYYFSYTVTENGFSLGIKNRSTATYVTFTFPRGLIGERPVISVNEPITFSQGGFLADKILVKSEKVQGLNDVIDARIASAIGSAIGGSY